MQEKGTELHIAASVTVDFSFGEDTIPLNNLSEYYF